MLLILDLLNTYITVAGVIVTYIKGGTHAHVGC